MNKTSGFDSKTSPRRRAYSTNQISDYNPAKKVYTPSDPSSVVAKNPLRRAKVQELIGQMSPEHEAQWRSDYQVWSHTVKCIIHMTAFKMICTCLVCKIGQHFFLDSVNNLVVAHRSQTSASKLTFFFNND